MKAIKLIPALLWFSWTVGAVYGPAAHAQLDLPASGTVDDLKTLTATRPDPDSALDPAELLASDAGFEPFDPALDESSGPVWLRLELRPSPASSGRYVLRVSRRFFDQFDYYIQAPGQPLQTGTLAFNTAVDAELVGRDYVIDFSAPPGDATTLLILVSTVQQSLQPVELWIQDFESFHAARAETLLVLGLIFGVLLALIFHNFVLYLNLGQRGHLYYVLAMLSLLLLLGADSGLLQNYLLPEFLQPYAIRFYTLFSALMMLTISLFFRYFVHSARYTPRMDRVVRVLIVVLAAGAAAVMLVPGGWFLPLAIGIQQVLVLALFLLLVGAFLAGRRGSTEGYIFLAAWLAFVISGFSRSLMTLDLIPRADFLEYLMYLGAVAEASILALGLAHRVRQLYERHARALEEQHKAARLANLDPLTNVYNRRFLKTYLESVLPGDSGRPFDRAVLILDLDNFKEANDTYGHAAGDEILRELSQRCSDVIRERDVLCRLGGDEFVIVLADQADGDPMEVAERIIAAVGDTPFTFEGQQIEITTSVGVVSFIAPNAAVSEILRMADQALYQAKRAGRNRATRFDPDRDSPFRHGTSLPPHPQEQQ